MSPALAGEFLTAGPPRESKHAVFCISFVYLQSLPEMVLACHGSSHFGD